VKPYTTTTADNARILSAEAGQPYCETASDDPGDNHEATAEPGSVAWQRIKRAELDRLRRAIGLEPNAAADPRGYSTAATTNRSDA